MGKYVLGMDIGGTNTRLGLMDSQCELHDFVIESSEELQNNGDTVDNLIQMIENYMRKHAKDREIIAICAGFPSTIDKDRKVVLSTPNIKGFDNIPIVDCLEKAFHIPVFIETDVNMLILYDLFKNQISDEGVACGFYFGTGLGNAITVNGELLTGKNGASAELGHIPVRGINGFCGCGNRSCVELIASGYKLRQICAEWFPEVYIGDVFTRCADKPEIRQFIDDLAAAVATEINILDPDYLILGGGLTKMNDFPFEYLEACIYKYARKPYPAEALEYIYSEPGQENGVIGAGILGLKKITKRQGGDESI